MPTRIQYHNYLAQRIKSASSLRKPAVPTKIDRPITGLKSDKNFVITNIIDTVLSRIILINFSYKKEN